MNVLNDLFTLHHKDTSSVVKPAMFKRGDIFHKIKTKQKQKTKQKKKQQQKKNHNNNKKKKPKKTKTASL